VGLSHSLFSRSISRTSYGSSRNWTRFQYPKRRAQRHYPRNAEIRKEEVIENGPSCPYCVRESVGEGTRRQTLPSSGRETTWGQRVPSGLSVAFEERSAPFSEWVMRSTLAASTTRAKRVTSLETNGSWRSDRTSTVETYAMMSCPPRTVIASTWFRKRSYSRLRFGIVHRSEKTRPIIVAEMVPRSHQNSGRSRFSPDRGSLSNDLANSPI